MVAKAARYGQTFPGAKGWISSFPPKDFFEVGAETRGKELLVRSVDLVPVDRWTVPQGQQISVGSAFPEPDPRLCGSAGILDKFPLRQGKNRPEKAAGRLEAVGLQEEATNFNRHLAAMERLPVV